jgi:mono/diheme cytochrome c family protein
MSSAGLRGLALLVAAVAFAVATPFAVGAGRKHGDQPGNAANGKVLFKAFCGKCHIMEAAGSKGTIGPNLDTDKVAYTGVVSAVIQGVGGIQAEYLLRALTFSQIYDVAKFVTTARTGT